MSGAEGAVTREERPATPSSLRTRLSIDLGPGVSASGNQPQTQTNALSGRRQKLVRKKRRK